MKFYILYYRFSVHSDRFNGRKLLARRNPQFSYPAYHCTLKVKRVS